MAEALVILAYVATFGSVIGYAGWLHLRNRRLGG